VDHEVPLASAARGGGGTGSGTDPADVRDAGSADRAGSGVGGPCAHAGVGTAALGTGQAGAVHQGSVVAAAAGRIPALEEDILGAAAVGAGVLLRDGGRGERGDAVRQHREPEVGRGREGVPGRRARVALSRLQPGTSKAALAALTTFSRNQTHRHSVGGRLVRPICARFRRHEMVGKSDESGMVCRSEWSASGV